MSGPDVPAPLDVQWHDVLPDGYKGTYTAGDEPSFTLFAGNGRAIVPGTVVLEGSIECSINNFVNKINVLDAEDHANLDKQVGVHALIRGTNTANEARGQIENIGAYPTAVRMTVDGTRTEVDVSTKSDLAAIRTPIEHVGLLYLNGAVVTDTGVLDQPGPPPVYFNPVGSYTQDATFSFAPQIILNRASGPISFARTGQIRTTFRLARETDAFYGPALNEVDFSYRITGLRLRYNTIAATHAPAAVQALTYMTSEHTLSSNVSSITTVFPAADVRSFTMAFRSQIALQDAAANSLITERLIGLNSLVISLNDAINGPITKPVRDEMEALRLGLMSLGSAPLNSQIQARIAASDGWLIGYPLGQPMDVSRVPFTVTISADAISNLTPYLMTVVAHATVQIYGQAQA